MTNERLSDLVGKRILEIRINENRDFISFKTDQGFVSYEAEADCCSKSWIEHICNIGQILGKKITFVEDVELADIEGLITSRGVGEHVEIYAYRISCAADIDDAFKGYMGESCSIDLRNDSNGYYGGYFELYEGTFTETHFNELKPVKEDF